MPINIVDYALPNSTHNKYDVLFHSNIIHTMVTHTPSMVDKWLLSIKPYRLNKKFLVGLHVERCLPNDPCDLPNTAAVLQLCIGGECLIFQIFHSTFIPESLIEFLGNKNNLFVGVGINFDVEKLRRDYFLSVKNFVELRTVVAQKFGEKNLNYVGLTKLAFRVLGKKIKKPKSVTMSNWSDLQLTAGQVKYACVDAFILFEIGRQYFRRV